MLKMSPEELFKTCSQLAILRHNIPSQHQTITLKEDEIARLAEAYLKEMIQHLK
jgi:23S rRNA maturation-related 3'-5' exoribonuclease YhaM